MKCLLGSEKNGNLSRHSVSRNIIFSTLLVVQYKARYRYINRIFTISRSALYFVVQPMSLSITTHTVVEGILGKAAVCSASQYRPNTAVLWLQIDDDNITSVPDITLTQNVTTLTFTIVAMLKLILNRENNGQRVSCLIAHDTLHTPQITADTIHVYCKFIVMLCFMPLFITMIYCLL